MRSLSAASTRNFSLTDLLLVAPWVVMVTICATHHVAAFFLWSVAGGAILILRRAFWGGGRGDLTVAFALPLFVALSAFGNAWVIRMTPHTRDALLLQWDFGVEAAVRSWAVASPLMPTIEVVYNALPFAVILAVAATSGAMRSRLLWALGLGGALVVPCYVLCPAVGPVHLAEPYAFRNCMPSMHLTWALLLPVHLRGRFRWAAWFFAAITALTTLATGEHYLPDLIAALPWTALLTLIASQIVSKLRGESHGTGRATI